MSVFVEVSSYNEDVIVTNLTLRQLGLVVEWFEEGSQEDYELYCQMRDLYTKCVNNED